jgi:ABC-2 type transport system ATP-binding protein
MEPVIQVKHLTHRYGAIPALEDLTFSVSHGEVFGLLGPNGAGKTTTVRLLNGLFHPQAGSIRVLGLDPLTQGEQVRRQSGVLTETPALYERLTAQQNLEFFGTLAGMSSVDLKVRCAELLSFFELSGRAGDRVGTYSKGMKQRLALARTLLARPALLFLDEPMAGLDPEAAAHVHELITSIRTHNGQTVLLATHNLFDAQRQCDRLAILKRGRLVAIGTLEELRQRVAPGLWVQVEFWQPAPGSASSLEGIPGVLHVSSVVNGLRLQVKDQGVVPQVVACLVAQGAQLLSVQPQQVSLEEIYFKLQNEPQEAEAIGGMR